MFFLAFFGLIGPSCSTALGPRRQPDLRPVAAVCHGPFDRPGHRGGCSAALSHSETSTAASAADYIGRSGRAMVGFGAGDLGKVRLTLKGTTVDVLATTEEERGFSPPAKRPSSSP